MRLPKVNRLSSATIEPTVATGTAAELLEEALAQVKVAAFSVREDAELVRARLLHIQWVFKSAMAQSEEWVVPGRALGSILASARGSMGSILERARRSVEGPVVPGLPRLSSLLSGTFPFSLRPPCGWKNR